MHGKPLASVRPIDGTFEDLVAAAVTQPGIPAIVRAPFAFDVSGDHQRLLQLLPIISPAKVAFFARGEAVRGLQRVGADRFGATDVALDFTALRRCVTDGGTLVLVEIQSALRDFAPAVEMLQGYAKERVWSNVFLSVGLERGVAPHWDDNHVFVIQTHGTRKWRLSPPVIDSPVAGLPPYVEHEGPQHDVTLNLGDALFVPWGWVHSTTPTSDVSVHVMLSYRPRTGIDFVKWLLQELPSDPQARREVTVQTADELREAVGNRLRPADVVRFFEERQEEQRGSVAEELVRTLDTLLAGAT